MTSAEKLQCQSSKNRTVLVVTGMICTTILLCSFFIWPTPYKYEKVTWYGEGTAGEELHQINRFTGQSRKIVDPLMDTSSYDEVNYHGPLITSIKKAGR